MQRWLGVLTLLLTLLVSGCQPPDRWLRPFHAPALSPAEQAYVRALQRAEATPPDHAGAVRAYREAARIGHAGAQYALGMSHYLGRGVVQDFAAARRWLKPAADQGHGAAQYFLGDLYLNGRATPVEVAWGMQWIARAADRGYAPAQYALGVGFTTGLGVARDRSEGLFWLRLAGEAGHPPAQTLLARKLPTLRQAEGAGLDARLAAWRPYAGARRLEPALVRFVQSQLNRLGYEAGPVDGLSGPRTRAAIAAYLKARSLPGQGIEAALIEALRDQVRAAQA